MAQTLFKASLCLTRALCTHAHTRAHTHTHKALQVERDGEETEQSRMYERENLTL